MKLSTFRYILTHPIRSRKIRKIAKNMAIDNKYLLDRLGSDYDRYGIPYWDKAAVDRERNSLLDIIREHRVEYLKYRGSSFNKDGTLFWAKDDAMAYSEGLDYVIELITERMTNPKVDND